MRFAREHDLLIAVRGGGIGWLKRKYGLACDNLLGVELVTANGEVVRAHDRDNPDLF